MYTKSMRCTSRCMKCTNKHDMYINYNNNNNANNDYNNNNDNNNNNTTRNSNIDNNDDIDNNSCNLFTACKICVC